MGACRLMQRALEVGHPPELEGHPERPTIEAMVRENGSPELKRALGLDSSG